MFVLLKVANPINLLWARVLTGTVLECPLVVGGVKQNTEEEEEKMKRIIIIIKKKDTLLLVPLMAVLYFIALIIILRCIIISIFNISFYFFRSLLVSLQPILFS